MLKSQVELKRLMEWARRKRLAGVRRHYEQQLNRLDERLLIYRARNRRIFMLVQWIHCFKTQLQPLPVYYKGYAAKYRRAK